MTKGDKASSIEIEAKTVKEAIKIALKKLSLSRKDVDVKVLREEESGLFGMEGSELAKIRVTIKKTLDI